MNTPFTPFTLNNYIIFNTLGSGLSSIVYEAKNAETNQYVAIKLLNKYIDDNSISSMISKMYQMEVKILKQCNTLNNKNIIRLIQHFESRDQYVLVLELCDRSLKQYLQKQLYVKEEHALDIFLQIYNGFSGLQNNKYYHRDIKPSNIMFKENQIKIIDFGFCKQKQNVQNSKQNTRCGTIGYQAPEVSMGYYDLEKSDIYSLGVVYYEILYGLQNFENIKQFTYPKEKEVSEKTKTLIDLMVQDSYGDRISWQQIGSILNAIKNNFNKKYDQSFQLDENLKQKFSIFQKILQDFQTLRKQIKDFPSETLELLLIKKMIFDFEKTKLEFEEQKLQLERQLTQLEDNYQKQLQILQNHSLRIKLNKLISDLEDERYRSLNENRKLKLQLCNDHFKKYFSHLNEELFNEQSENFKKNLEKEINKFFSYIQNLTTSENSLQIKLLKINILLIKYSDHNNFKLIKDRLLQQQLIFDKQLSMVKILDSITNESADKFEKCLKNLDYDELQ